MPRMSEARQFPFVFFGGLRGGTPDGPYDGEGGRGRPTATGTAVLGGIGGGTDGAGLATAAAGAGAGAGAGAVAVAVAAAGGGEGDSIAPPHPVQNAAPASAGVPHELQYRVAESVIGSPP